MLSNSYLCLKQTEIRRIQLDILWTPKGCSGSSVLLKSHYFSFESNGWHLRALGLSWDSEELASDTEIAHRSSSGHQCQVWVRSTVAVIMKHPWNLPDNSFFYVATFGCLYETRVSVNGMGDVCKWSGSIKVRRN